MAEPAAQGAAGRNTLRPGAHVQVGFLDISRPKPLHEKTGAVGGPKRSYARFNLIIGILVCQHTYR